MGCKVMKKKITWILCIVLVLFIPACKKEEEAPLKSGIYTLQGVERDVLGDFTITVYEDGTFQCYETLISSYIGIGHYSTEDDTVTFKEDEPGCTGDINFYQIADDKLLFIHDGSANYHFVPLEDGASFVWTADAPQGR